jgi:hypothetical protein
MITRLTGRLVCGLAVVAASGPPTGAAKRKVCRIDGSGRLRPCPAIYKVDDRSWRDLPASCWIDDGHPTVRPCSSAR